MVRAVVEGLPDVITLKTVYRATDPSHLDFLNRIRAEQPERKEVEEYFHGRKLGRRLESAVASGLRYTQAGNGPFL
eukprot:10586023-Alexandrium_andersonii.AAC.1